MKKSITTSVQNIAYFLSAIIILGTFLSTNQAVAKPEPDKQKIMLALLLDTSNSMDGLIEQAKSQLWTIVNELSSAKCGDGSQPEIEIALFEYGNDRLPQSEGYMRMVTNLTSDLDEISAKLFQLSTNGGEEFCGYAIDKSIKKLDWSKSKADLKLIFIAGNEPFSQGNVAYESACSLAKEHNIVVNTIFCGNYNEGVNTSWRHGAVLTGGSYMSIEQNQKTVYIKTPYDDKIDKLNDKMNKTYIYYGAQGKSKKEQQLRQDANAASYSQANKVKRTISKSSHAYKSASWDLVDAYEEDATAIESVEEEYLPEEMQDMGSDEKKAYVKELADERQSIKNEIQALSLQRTKYLADNEPSDSPKNTLDQAMINSIKTVGKSKNFVFK